jgi:hypothetical protein
LEKINADIKNAEFSADLGTLEKIAKSPHNKNRLQKKNEGSLPLFSTLLRCA